MLSQSTWTFWKKPPWKGPWAGQPQEGMHPFPLSPTAAPPSAATSALQPSSGSRPPTQPAPPRAAAGTAASSGHPGRTHHKMCLAPPRPCSAHHAPPPARRGPCPAHPRPHSAHSRPRLSSLAKCHAPCRTCRSRTPDPLTLFQTQPGSCRTLPARLRTLPAPCRMLWPSLLRQQAPCTPSPTHQAGRCGTHLRRWGTFHPPQDQRPFHSETLLCHRGVRPCLLGACPTPQEMPP